MHSCMNSGWVLMEVPPARFIILISRGQLERFCLEQVRTVKQQLGITKDNAEWREEEIYRRANIAYKALSTSLGEHDFLFDNMPSSVDAIFHGLLCINKNHRLLVASIESQPFICFLSRSLILSRLKKSFDEMPDRDPISWIVFLYEGVLYGVIERCFYRFKNQILVWNLKAKLHSI
ncbi:hypothetical protein QYF36_021077 [Acer negundo]|nr:hypothetical protein QYF36_021077 [Acer negundo]